MEEHFLLLPHRKVESEEIASILEEFNISSVNQLPKLKKNDPAVKLLIKKGAEIAAGDVVEITRRSFVGEVKYYRVIITEK